MPTEEPAITTLGERGQIVIPQKLRKHLGMQPKTKFLVFGQGDLIILKRLTLPDVAKEWDKIFAVAAEVGLTEADIEREVDAHRKRK